MDAQYNLIEIPRWWVKDWMLNIWHLAFGQALATKQPFRWILFEKVKENTND